MEADAAATQATRGGGHGDMDGAIERTQELPERRGGVVAQHRSLSASEDCGHPALAMRNGEGTEGVNAVMNAMQLPFAHSDRDRPRPQPRFFELPPRHHSVLTSGYIRGSPIGGVTFCAHMGA